MTEENAPIENENENEVELSDEELFNAEKKEQLESIEEQLTTERAVLEIGKAAAMLSKNKQFIKVIGSAFVKDGKEFLWENIRNNREADLLEKGSARTENIARFESELQARLIFEKFFNSCLDDVELCTQKIQQLEELKVTIQNTKYTTDESEEL